MPYSLTFSKYHREHHKFQGYEEKDTDLASYFEINFFRNPLWKVLNFLALPILYEIRPQIVTPMPFSKKKALEYICIFTYNCTLTYFFGWSAVRYQLFSTYLSLSIQPFAIHLLTEHFETNYGQETYNY